MAARDDRCGRVEPDRQSPVVRFNEPVGSVEDVRAALLDAWRIAVERTGMIAVSADAAWAIALTTRTALATIDEVDAGRAWSDLAKADFGPLSAMTFKDWFTDHSPRGQGNAEVVAWESQVLAAFGWLSVDRLDAAAWSRLRLEDCTRFADGTWTLGRISEELPPPSLVVDRRVLCFAPTNPAASWAFFDMVYAFGFDARLASDVPLRSVRSPGPGHMHERTTLTPAGRRVASDLFGERDR